MFLAVSKIASFEAREQLNFVQSTSGWQSRVCFFIAEHSPQRDDREVEVNRCASDPVVGEIVLEFPYYRKIAYMLHEAQLLRVVNYEQQDTGSSYGTFDFGEPERI